MIHDIFNLAALEQKVLKNKGFLEKADAEDLQDFAEAALDSQFLLDDGHQHVDADGDPNLRLDGVDRRSVERLDPKVLLDPLEEQFHLPSTFVELSDGQRGQGEVVCQEDESLVDVLGVIADPSQGVRVERGSLGASQHDGAVAAQPGGLVHISPGPPHIIQAALAPDYEEGKRFGEGVKPGEVGVAAIHYVERAGLDRQQVQDPDIADAAAGNMHKTRDIAAQVQQRVQLDGALVPAELGPGKQRKAKVHGGRVEGIDGLFQIDGERLVGVERPCACDEACSQIRVEAPVALLVGLGQRVASGHAAEPGVIELGPDGPQAGLDVPQALPVCQLRECHRQKLVQARESSKPELAAVTSHAAPELVGG